MKTAKESWGLLFTHETQCLVVEKKRARISMVKEGLSEKFLSDSRNCSVRETTKEETLALFGLFT